MSSPGRTTRFDRMMMLLCMLCGAGLLGAGVLMLRPPAELADRIVGGVMTVCGAICLAAGWYEGGRNRGVS